MVVEIVIVTLEVLWRVLSCQPVLYHILLEGSGYKSGGCGVDWCASICIPNQYEYDAYQYEYQYAYY